MNDYELQTQIDSMSEDHEAQENDALRLIDRSYQIEMFEKSMQRNIIVCMGTGTGKTQIAKLRIEAELQRSPSKLIWFTAPKVFLVEQQYLRLKSQLPMYKFRLLTGEDKVDFWRSQSIWDAALENMHVVCSTPQILLDALGHGFVRITNISLLVIDEAHHAQANNPSLLIMRDHYHSSDPSQRPHILGLTASIRISHRTGTVKELEQNLDAVCQSPVRSIEDYTRRLNEPSLIELKYHVTPQKVSPILQTLCDVIPTLAMEDDPSYVALTQAADLRSEQKLEKIHRSGKTPLFEQLNALKGHAEHLFENLGTWAAERFVLACAQNWHDKMLDRETPWQIVEDTTANAIDQKLAPILALDECRQPGLTADTMSGRVAKLIMFLSEAYHPQVAVIIFVHRRSTAFALCDILQHVSCLQGYEAFSFVGIARSTGLVEVSDVEEQKEAFAGFRAGHRNLCVATSTVEEGIDVPAVDIVIRFDDPHQFVSYVQSRGRARHQNSKFVYMRAHGDDNKKYKDWNDFELELKRQYEKDREHLDQLKELEKSNTTTGEIYTIQSTGARLGYENALAILEHFCAVTCKGQTPVYILGGDETLQIRTARIVLPSTIQLPYRVANSKNTWPSERSAKRDAAFQVVKALHEGKLISDNLVPFREEREVQRRVKEKPILHNVDMQVHVWPRDEIQLWQYGIQISQDGLAWQEMTMTLPMRLDDSFEFDIAENFERKYRVRISVAQLSRPNAVAEDTAKTRLLFQHVFAQGSAWSSLFDESTIPFSIVPKCTVVEEELPFLDFLRRFPLEALQQPLFLWDPRRVRPFLWEPNLHKGTLTGSSTIMVTKVNRLKIFNSLVNRPGAMVQQVSNRLVPVNDCMARSMGSFYGPVVMLVPTILEIVQASLRAHSAWKSALSSIGFSSNQHILLALLAKSAFGTLNYERLEFIGDAILKFRVALQLYVENPTQLEDGLTEKSMRMISNKRLCKITLEQGLAQYVTTIPTPQKHWKLPKRCQDAEQSHSRNLSTKTLADVAESILGAAYIDGQQTGVGELLCTRVLTLYYPDHEWMSCAELIARIDDSNLLKINPNSALPRQAEALVGTRFNKPELLLQAVTHSASILNALSYDRLEYLGDALLDIIIKDRLYRHEELNPDTMTLHRHALASHTYLAYCALATKVAEVYHKPVVSGQRCTVSIESHAVSTCLADLLICSDQDTQLKIAAAKSKLSLLEPQLNAALATCRFPWTLLTSLDAPKACSDMIESLLAAIYLDSGARLEPCTAFLQRLGIFDVLETMTGSASYESQTPLAQLAELTAKKALRFDINVSKAKSRNSHSWTTEIRLSNVELGDVATYKNTAGCCAEESRLILVEKVVQLILSDSLSEPLACRSDFPSDRPENGTSEDGLIGSHVEDES